MKTKDKLTAVRDLLDTLLEVYDEQQGKLDPVDVYYRGKVEEWASKIHGVSSGYEAELMQMYKHRSHKGRAIFGGHADVSVGEPNDYIAKSIQLKSTNQDDPSAVSDMIRVAANQLTGERGETPRPGDRLVIDMTIHNADNPWPVGKGSMGSMNLEQFRSTAGDKLVDLLINYQRHVQPKRKRDEPPRARVPGHGMSPQLLASLTSMQAPVPLSQLSPQHPKSTQFYTPSPTQQGYYDKALHITVKIRYKAGYLIWDDQANHYQVLKLAVYNVYRENDYIRYQLVKSVFLP